MSEKKRGKGWLFAIMAAIALGAGWLWLSGGVRPPTLTERVVVEPRGHFFRVKASYTHGDEKIDFDYIAVCGFRTTIYKAGDKSMDGIYAPRVMIKATGDGGALLIRTPRACHGETTANGKAPHDLLPLVFWFDDVNDLTYGLGYVSPDAYDSPLAQIKFHGATIEAATAEDWQAWRDKAEAEYEQKGMLPGPWGYSYGDSRNPSEAYDPEERYIARTCHGYIRLKLPEEARAQIRDLWPLGQPSYWSPPSDKAALYMVRPAADGKWHRIDYGHGRTASSFLVPYDQGEIGVPTRGGGGTIGVYGPHYPADTFPILPRSRSTELVPTEPVTSYPRRMVVQENTKGFAACGGDAYVDYIEKFDLSFRKKKHPIFVNDDLAAQDHNPLVLPTVMYERDEYVFVEHWWGG